MSSSRVRFARAKLKGSRVSLPSDGPSTRAENNYQTASIRMRKFSRISDRGMDKKKKKKRLPYGAIAIFRTSNNNKEHGRLSRPCILRTRFMFVTRTHRGKFGTGVISILCPRGIAVLSSSALRINRLPDNSSLVR